MTRLTLRIVGLAMFLMPGCSPSAGVSESQEPPLRFNLKLGERTVVITEGETTQLRGKFEDPKVTLVVDPHRVFDFQGVSFQYPRSFGFEADLADPSAKSWTLSGNDFKIMLMVIQGSTTASEYADNLVAEFGEDNCRITDAQAKLRLGSVDLSGSTLRVNLAGHSMTMEVYLVDSTASAAKLLVFQDSLDEYGNRSNERKEALQVMASSFQVK
jgi:hypothetical protein